MDKNDKLRSILSFDGNGLVSEILSGKKTITLKDRDGKSYTTRWVTLNLIGSLLVKENTGDIC